MKGSSQCKSVEWTACNVRQTAQILMVTVKLIVYGTEGKQSACFASMGAYVCFLVPTQKGGMGACTCNPSAGDADTGGSLELLGA